MKDERERPQTTNCSVADDFPKTVLQCVLYASVPERGGVGFRPEISPVRAMSLRAAKSISSLESTEFSNSVSCFQS